MTTHRFELASATNITIKALVAGAIGAVILGLGIAHAEGQRELRASVITLEPVVITAKRAQIPTVYVTGHRDTTADDTQIASAQ